jgi:hypothetical protein
MTHDYRFDIINSTRDFPYSAWGRKRWGMRREEVANMAILKEVSLFDKTSRTVCF